jgi:hypothetical protein
MLLIRQPDHGYDHLFEGNSSMLESISEQVHVVVVVVRVDEILILFGKMKVELT